MLLLVTFSDVVHKLSHHSMEFGVTDAIQCVAGCLMLAAGYDLDNGVGYVNGEILQANASL